MIEIDHEPVFLLFLADFCHVLVYHYEFLLIVENQKMHWIAFSKQMSTELDLYSEGRNLFSREMIVY